MSIQLEKGKSIQNSVAVPELPTVQLDRTMNMNPHGLIMGKNGVATFSKLFLFNSFSYLQVSMTYITLAMPVC